MKSARFRARGGLLLDDRGERLRGMPLPANAKVSDIGRAPNAGDILPGVIMVTCVYLSLWLYNGSVWGGLVAVAAPVAILGYRYTTWRVRPRLETRLTPLSAHLTAHGRCGACGEDLGEEVHEDGWVECPRCHAAWHQDRIVIREAAELELGTSPSLVKRLRTALHEAHTCDDRGMILSSSLRWPPHWLGSWRTPADLEARLIAIATAKRKRFNSVVSAAALVVWAGAVAGLLSVSHTIDLGQIVLVMTITGLIVFLAVWAVSRLYEDHNVLLVCAAEVGVCCNCGRQLPLDGPITFDGCVVCTGCKRAWKRPESAAVTLKEENSEGGLQPSG